MVLSALWNSEYLKGCWILVTIRSEKLCSQELPEFILFATYLSSDSPLSSSLLMWKGVSSVPEAIIIPKVWFVSDITYDMIPKTKYFKWVSISQLHELNYLLLLSWFLPPKLRMPFLFLWFSPCISRDVLFDTLEMAVLARICLLLLWVSDGAQTKIWSLDACPLCLSLSYFLSCLQYVLPKD